MARASHLYQFHKENGRLTEFSGFDMPLWYRGIVDEHLAVRNLAGVFDVSHMGRIMIEGVEATKFLSYLLPTDPSKIKDNHAFYSVICNESGGILDDIVTNKYSSNKYLMVVNAGNREKDIKWIKQVAGKFEVVVEDISDQTALISFQGPKSSELLQKIVDTQLSQLKRFTFVECNVSKEKCLVSRTGYTGEDGFEIAVFDTTIDSPEKVTRIWTNLLEIGKEHGVLPCGLGARDTLRLEAGMCLYGNDISEETTPVEAALGFIVNLDDNREFIGKNVLQNQLRNGTDKKRVAFSMLEAGVPRHGYSILLSGKKVGTVTSGTFSPIMKKGIGMGYVPNPISEIGSNLSVEIRDTVKIGQIVRTPFYDTTRYGYKRAG